MLRTAFRADERSQNHVAVTTDAAGANRANEVRADHRAGGRQSLSMADQVQAAPQGSADARAELLSRGRFAGTALRFARVRLLRRRCPPIACARVIVKVSQQ